MTVTIHQIAEAAGVSIATVSRALNNSGHPVNEKTKERIITIADELGYRPNRLARSLRTDRSSIIAVILDNFTSVWAPVIIRGLQDIFHKAGYFCLVVNVPWEIHSQAKAMQDLLSHSVAGFIFVETWHPISAREEMLQGKPYTIVHRLFHEPSQYSVIPDDGHNAALAVNHLIRLGHQRIGYIQGPENYFSARERLLAYQNALTAAGIPIRKAYINTDSTDWEIPSGYQAAQQLLSLTNPPTALIAANDLMAYGAILAVQAYGLSVPDDVAVVGHDNDEIAQVSNPTITTVQMPLFRMGQVTAENLLNQIHNQEVVVDEQHIRGQLMIRQSCGDPTGKQQRAQEFMRHLQV